MARMQALRLMPSHTYFYKKLNDFGKDHNQHILYMVDKGGKRRTAVAKLKMLVDDGKDISALKNKLKVSNF